MGLLVGFTTEVTEGTEDFEERSAGSSELGSGTFNLGDGADLFGERGALKLFSCCPWLSWTLVPPRCRARTFHPRAREKEAATCLHPKPSRYQHRNSPRGCFLRNRSKTRDDLRPAWPGAYQQDRARAPLERPTT